MAQVVEHLPSKYKAFSPTLFSLKKIFYPVNQKFEDFWEFPFPQLYNIYIYIYMCVFIWTPKVSFPREIISMNLDSRFF
jgi:hypothetical protein